MPVIIAVEIRNLLVAQSSDWKATQIQINMAIMPKSANSFCRVVVISYPTGLNRSTYCFWCKVEGFL
jgi:hypothetical protein